MSSYRAGIGGSLRLSQNAGSPKASLVRRHSGLARDSDIKLACFGLHSVPSGLLLRLGRVYVGS